MQLTNDADGGGGYCLSQPVGGPARVHAGVDGVDAQQVQGNVVKVVRWTEPVT